MSAFEALVREFSRLPGIGPRTAQRLVHHLLKGPPGDLKRLAQALEDVAERVRPCARCGAFTEMEVCQVCRDPARDGALLCVVEGASEVHALEATGRFRGRFHVLGGRLSPLDGIGPEQLRVSDLLNRVREGQEGIQEVILATSPSVEGEATAVYLEEALRPFAVRVTRLARGLPVGSDLEYVDGSTLAEALAGRREVGSRRPG
jgi:recombination protein RecR